MKRILLYTLLQLTIIFNAFSQIQESKEPYSKRINLKNMELQTLNLKKPNIDSVKNAENNSSKARPFKFGEKIFVDYSIYDVGAWTNVANGGKLWTLDLKVEGALSLNFIFKKYRIPEGAEFYIYNEQNQIGAFTYKNNQADEKFATTILKGDNVRLEYYEPANVAFRGEIILSEIVYGFVDVFKVAKAFGSSGSCNVNAVCDPTWENQKRSVVMLVVDGSGFCTGSLVNNTGLDFKPYILTANHCYGSNESTWVFWFNWEAPTCVYSGTTPTYNSMSGSVLRTRGAASDYCLVEINNPVPSSFNPFYAGWNKSSTPATSGVGIHHPAGDIKKISAYSVPNVLGSYGSSTNHHWRANWGTAITEPGSSGSPLFDENKRIVGQLHGGPSACGASAGNLNDFYGAIHMSFPAGLGTYLDPQNTGAITLDGINACTIAATMSPVGTQAICSGTGTPINMSVTPLSGATYQWFRNGINVGTNSATYSSNLEGVYSVQITTSTCTQTFGSLSLINNAPAITISATNNQVICFGSTSPTVIRLSPKPTGATYQWKWNGNNIPGQTKDSLIVTTGGTYSVQRNFCQTNSLSNQLSILTPPQSPDPIVSNKVVCPFENGISPNFTLESQIVCDGTTVINSTSGTAGYDGGLSSIANPTIINSTATNPSKIIVSVTFEKKSQSNQNSCGLAHDGSDPYNWELSFKLKGPTGVISTLIPSGNYTYSNYGGVVTVVFDDLAATMLNSTYPLSGTYQPNQNLMSTFGSLNSLGTWELIPYDNGGGDPLCVSAFSMTFVTEQKMEWRSSASGSILATSVNFTPTNPNEGLNTYFVSQQCSPFCPSSQVPVTLNVDCNCANASNITTVGEINASKQATGTIITASPNSTNSANKVDYKAGQSITILPGFATNPSAGGTFKAAIEGCN